MPRQAHPTIWRKWYVTKAGGQGIHKLCSIEEGIVKAKDNLKKWLQKCRLEKAEANRLGLVDTDTPYTVWEIIATFLDSKSVTKKKSTIIFYKRFLKKWGEWYGDKEVRKLKRTDGDAYLIRLKELGLNSITINRHIGSVKTVLNYAVECDIIAKNPFRKIPKLAENGRNRIITDDEFQKLLAAAEGSIAWKGKISKEDNAQTMKDILFILRFSGLRPGEVRKLRWDHLRLSGEGPVWFIVIPKTEHKTGTTSKKPRDREVPFLTEAREIFLRRQEKYGQQQYVFPNLNNVVWNDSDFSKRFAMLRKRAGIEKENEHGEKLVWYSLRHTRLTEAGTIGGWSMFNLMALAGHTDPKMTARYIHPQKEELARAMVEESKHK